MYQNQSEIENDVNIAEDPRKENGQIQPGDVKFLDLNGDQIIDDKDRTIIGIQYPNSLMVSMRLRIKRLIYHIFPRSCAVDIYNADRMQGIDPTYPFNMYAETINRWHGEGTSNSIPRMTTSETT